MADDFQPDVATSHITDCPDQSLSMLLISDTEASDGPEMLAACIAQGFAPLDIDPRLGNANFQMI